MFGTVQSHRHLGLDKNKRFGCNHRYHTYFNTYKYIYINLLIITSLPVYSLFCVPEFVSFHLLLVCYSSHLLSSWRELRRPPLADAEGQKWHNQGVWVHCTSPSISPRAFCSISTSAVLSGEHLVLQQELWERLCQWLIASTVCE